MKILCLTKIKHIDGAWNNLCKCGNVEYVPTANRSEATHAIAEHTPDVIFVNPNEMTYKLNSELLNGVKIVCTASTGLNHIDVEYCNQNGIKVISLTKDYDTIRRISSTAEHAFALTLALIRNIPRSFDAVKSGYWNSSQFIGRQLNHLAAGVVGYGRLGRMYARYCSAFGMRVLVSDPYQEPDEFPNLPLHKLLQNVDIISLHIHLSDKTRNIIGKDVLSAGKKGMYLVNTSRGEVVNESEIVACLESNVLAGYATDVVADELCDIGNSEIIRRSCDLNIIVTPHTGGATIEAQNIAYNGVIDALWNVITQH